MPKRQPPSKRQRISGSDPTQRILIPPPRGEIERRLSRLVSQTKVASSFGVSGPTLAKRVSGYDIVPPRISVLVASNGAKQRFAEPGDRVRVAHWLVDEGSVSVDYPAKHDSTYLVLRGSMVDDRALGVIASIMGARISRGPKMVPSHLPTQYVRVYGAKAYALLEEAIDDLRGPKSEEAKAALAFFPRSGSVSGWHTADGFLLNARRSYALKATSSWNGRRAIPCLKWSLGVSQENG